MNRFTKLAAGLALAFASTLAIAAKDDLDAQRLSNSLDQLANDPTLGGYAQGEQARARDAINRLYGLKSKERAHALYIAERRVDVARAAAQLQDAQSRIAKLDREHDQILLDTSRLEVENARRELDRQRQQAQAVAAENARLQQEGMDSAQAAEQARAEADQSRKLAEAQAKVANAAKRQAAAATAAARALRNAGDSGSATPSKKDGQ
jgi:hypothetical protein